MKRIFFTVAVATTMTVFGLQAQSNLPRIETVSGKEKAERAAAEAYFDNTRHERAAQRTNPYINKEETDFVLQNGVYLTAPADNRQKTLGRNGQHQHQTPKMLPKNMKVDYVTKKSGKSDVATITFEVIGNPMEQHGFTTGFHMILDADAEMYSVFWDYFWDAWDVLYDLSEYKIPENASPDLTNSNTLLDDIVSIEVPEGIYDFSFFLVPGPEFTRIYQCYLNMNGVLYFSLIDDFEFKAGLEYIFTVENGDMIEFFPENDAALIEIILPPVSLDLTNQEDVSVVLHNAGSENITGDIDISYKVNDETPITETYSITMLAPGEEVIYTFIAKADFSEGGLYVVDAWVGYDLDMNILNDTINGFTQKPIPIELPFYENFESNENLMANWTIIDVNNDNFGWRYNYWGRDADGVMGGGCIEAQAPWLNPTGIADDYLISNPMIIPEAGTYNLSFWVDIYGQLEKMNFLYGTTSNYEEMTILEEFELTQPDGSERWNVVIRNFEMETPGNYYFAFHYITHTAASFPYIIIDNIQIAAGVFVGVPDIFFNNVMVPVSSCDLNDENIIGAEVSNRGSEPISEFTLTYQVGDKTPVSQTFYQTIDIRESIKVYFDVPVDFSEIGIYDIKFTAATPNEENIDNNETETKVRHFAPVTALPFESNFADENGRYDWNPEEQGGWRFMESDKCYYSDRSSISNIPLLSRCFYFEPGIYRFTMSVSTLYPGTNDFYLSFGKTSTNPYEWEPIKIYNNYSTTQGYAFEKDDEFVILEITEAGEYVFAIFPVRLDGMLAIFGATIEVAPAHDIQIKKVEPPIYARLTPKYHTEGEYKYTAILQNKGTTANESGNITLSVNNNIVDVKNFEFTEMGEILNVDLRAVIETLEPGIATFSFKATFAEEKFDEFEMYREITDSTFALDNIDTGFVDGVGFNGMSGSIGMIYELQKPDIVTSITLGLWWRPYSDDNIGLEVYSVNADFELEEMFLEINHPRTNGNNQEGITFDVPDTQLPPGRYYFGVRQYTTNNVAIAYDNDLSNGRMYWVEEDGDGLIQLNSLGFMHLRPNFSKYGVGISSEKATEPQLTVYPNPVKGILNVSLGETIIENAVIYNTSGQIIASISNINDSNFMFDTEKLNSGLYFITVQTKTGIVSSKFVVHGTR